MKATKLKRFINNREVTKWFGLLHEQFQCAEQMFYEGSPCVALVVKTEGNAVVYRITNTKLKDQWLGR